MRSSGAAASWDVIGLGANSVDFVYTLPAGPQLSGPRAKMRVRSHFVSCGGQVATALCCCAALGLRAKYIGVTGNDDNGRLIREELARREIDLADAISRNAPNQFAAILVDEQSGERIVLWDRDDRLQLGRGELRTDLLCNTRVLHVDDVDQDAAIEAARLAGGCGVQVTSDIDRITDRTIELVRSVTFPIFAEHVPRALTGEQDLERALRKLRREHSGPLCVTLGASGAIALDGDRFMQVPAFKVRAVDTTGAGDVFRGGYIYALLAGWSLEAGLRFANAAAAVSCARWGAINGVPTLDEVEQLMGGSGSR